MHSISCAYILMSYPPGPFWACQGGLGALLADKRKPCSPPPPPHNPPLLILARGGFNRDIRVLGTSLPVTWLQPAPTSESQLHPPPPPNYN